MTVPAMVRFVRQSGHHPDCAVACLAMSAGVLYEDALAAAAVVAPAVLQEGLTWRQIRETAEVLGMKTKLKRKYDISEATGILNVAKRNLEHVVFLWEGRIVEGNGELWLCPDEYLAHYRCKAKNLLVALDDEKG